MKFFLVMTVFGYAMRRFGWFWSKRLFYRDSGVSLIIMVAAWGLAVAWMVYMGIAAAMPGPANRWIMGYALGAYVAIPNYGLLIESAIPDHSARQHAIIKYVPFVTYIVVLAGLSL